MATECSNHNLVEESRDGGHFQVCLNCGIVVSESSSLEATDEYEGRREADQRQLRTTSLTVRRQESLRGYIAAFSEKVKLPQKDQQICQDQGRQILGNWTESAQLLAARLHLYTSPWPHLYTTPWPHLYTSPWPHLCPTPLQYLVFIACRKHRPCMSYKEFSNCVYIRVKRLARCVKKATMELKKLTVAEEEEEVFKQTDENIQIELEQVVSRLELKNPQEVMTKAFDLLTLLRGNTKVVLTSQSFLCAVTMCVIQHQMGIKICRSEFNSFAQKLGLLPTALRGRTSTIKKELLKLAKKIPTLEGEVASHNVNMTNVEKYINTILEYRWLLSIPDDHDDNLSDETKTTPTPSTSLMSQKWIPPNDDTPLESEAYDVDEYINTDDEAREKEQKYSLQMVSAPCTSRKQKSSRKSSKRSTPYSIPAGQKT